MPRFSSEYRLKTKQDFQSVFAKPLKKTHKYLTSLVVANKLTHARLGIIINKQHIRLASTRNALRRVIRESFRTHEISAEQLDIVILIRAEWHAFKQKTSKQHWRDDIHHLWQSILIHKQS